MFIDDIGGRMKGYEKDLSDLVLNPALPSYARIDGRAFSRLTRSLRVEKPRDARFERALVSSAVSLMKETSACFAYVQSDEVSLFFRPVDPPTQSFFGGRAQKLGSVLASAMASAFRHHMAIEMPDRSLPEIVSFDARLCNFPDIAEATNMLVWRRMDAVRNEINDRALHAFGSKTLDRVSTAEKLEMLGRPAIKGGVFLKPVRTDVGGGVTRGRVREIEVDFESMSFSDRVDLIFGDETRSGVMPDMGKAA